MLERGNVAYYMAGHGEHNGVGVVELFRIVSVQSTFFIGADPFDRIYYLSIYNLEIYIVTHN